MSELRNIESAEARNLLLRFARQSAQHFLGARRADELEPPQIAGTFGGVFVTFWRGKTLRGCVGTFAPIENLATSVADMTKASLCDSRFVSHPVLAAELPTLVIEISVLSTPEVTSDPVSLVPGVHGIIIRRGAHTGCFLPKVASDRGWSAEEFLAQCCEMKAGLSRDAWQDEATEVQFFTADVISESKPPAS